MTADLAVLASDPSAIERSADPGAFVVLACERAKQWLAQALEHGDIDSIAETKAQAEAIRVYTAQKQLGHDAELAAAEIVRRAERGIGVAIRRGQEAGTVMTRADGPQVRDGNLSPTGEKFQPSSLWKSRNEGSDVYAVTDGVTDDQFDAALEEAKAEGNLSRANVVRKVKGEPRPAPEPGKLDRSTEATLARRQQIRDMAGTGHSSAQIARQVGVTEQHVRDLARDMGVQIAGDQVLNRTRRQDSNRIVSETVHALEGICLALPLIKVDQLDASQVDAWSDSLKQSIRSLNQLLKELNQA